MTDYTKLIKALRYCKINEPCERCPLVADDDGNGKCVNELHDNAVDAIEKLVAENERLNGIIDVFVNDGTSVPSPWISVKDRLPEESGRYVFRYWNANDACFDADIWMTGERRTDEQ